MCDVISEVTDISYMKRRVRALRRKFDACPQADRQRVGAALHQAKLELQRELAWWAEE